MLNLAILGLGRIGKNLLRTLIEENHLNQYTIRFINEIKPLTDQYLQQIAYHLKYDSTYGTAKFDLTVEDQYLICNQHKILVFNQVDLLKLDWQQFPIDIVIDATGNKANLTQLQSLLSLNLVKKVIITNSDFPVDFTCLYGVNQHHYKPKQHHLISASTCTGNAFIPFIKMIDEQYKINNGIISTIHASLPSDLCIDAQIVGDQASRAGTNLRLTNSKVVYSALQVLPHLSGYLSEQVISFRIPTPIVSLIYANLVLNTMVTTDEVKRYLCDMIDKQYPHILSHTKGFLGMGLVSSDFIKTKYSGIVELNSLQVHKQLLSLCIWHDNEYGYICRLIDVINLIVSLWE